MSDDVSLLLLLSLSLEQVLLHSLFSPDLLPDVLLLLLHYYGHLDLLQFLCLLIEVFLPLVLSVL